MLWRVVGSALAGALKSLASHFTAYWAGRSAGKQKERRKQVEETLEQVERGEEVKRDLADDSPDKRRERVYDRRRD